MTLQKKVMDHIRSIGGWCCKVESASERGVPDIIACISGRFVAIEIKQTKRDRLSPIQEEQLFRIVKAGGKAWEVRDFEIFKGLIERVKK